MRRGTGSTTRKKGKPGLPPLRAHWIDVEAVKRASGGDLPEPRGTGEVPKTDGLLAIVPIGDYEMGEERLTKREAFLLGQATMLSLRRVDSWPPSANLSREARALLLRVFRRVPSRLCPQAVRHSVPSRAATESGRSSFGRPKTWGGALAKATHS